MPMKTSRMIDGVSDSDRQRLMMIVRDLVPSIPERPLLEVEREIAEIRAARRGGGRRSIPRGS